MEGQWEIEEKKKQFSSKIVKTKFILKAKHMYFKLMENISGILKLLNIPTIHFLPGIN